MTFLAKLNSQRTMDIVRVRISNMEIYVTEGNFPPILTSALFDGNSNFFFFGGGRTKSRHRTSCALCNSLSYAEVGKTDDIKETVA